MSPTEQVAIGEPPFDDCLGPDVEFLRLPKDLVGSLMATNVFLNLGKRAGHNEPDARPYFDAVVGIIAERTSNLAGGGANTVRKSVEALFGLGNVVKEYGSRGFDFFSFKVGFDPAVQRPLSYGGTSGGGVWRISLSHDLVTVRTRKLVGMAFCESPIVDGERTLTCHGPQSIYGSMIERVRPRWPA